MSNITQEEVKAILKTCQIAIDKSFQMCPDNAIVLTISVNGKLYEIHIGPVTFFIMCATKYEISNSLSTRLFVETGFDIKFSKFRGYFFPQEVISHSIPDGQEELGIH